LNRSYMKRGPTKNNRRTSQAAYELVASRSMGICEEDGCYERAAHIHHIIPRRMGGTTNHEVHSVNNLIALCAKHHRERHGL